MQAKVYTLTGEENGSVELNDAIFARDWNNDLVYQALQAFKSNARRPWAHTKDRSEVRGGGRKPWAQKGTGRARHGSSRSPIWIGGGVTHGPRKDRDYSVKINKKMKRNALHTVLSKKLKDGELKFIEAISDTKTKALDSALKSLFKGEEKPSSTLIVASSANKNAKKASSNLKNLDAQSTVALNIYDLLSHKNILIEKEAVSEIK